MVSIISEGRLRCMNITNSDGDGEPNRLRLSRESVIRKNQEVKKYLHFQKGYERDTYVKSPLKFSRGC